MFKIGKLELGKQLKIIGIVSEKISLDDLLSLPEQVAVLEFRIDSLLESLSEDAIENYLKQVCELNRFAILLTIRVEGLVDNALKQHLFKRFVHFVDAVDIELDCLAKQEYIRQARELNKLVLISHHDFEQTPTDDIMASWLMEAGDIVKLAVMANSPEDVQRLYAFTANNRDRGLITISMGDLGKESRVKAFQYGSLLTYAPLTVGNAPGQLSVTEIVNQLES